LVTKHAIKQVDRLLGNSGIDVWESFALRVPRLVRSYNGIEDTCLRRLSAVIPPGCRVTILADRGFGDHKLFAYLADLGFAYVVRFRGNIPCHRCLRRDADRSELDWPIGTGTQAARRPRHRIARLSGRRRGLCACT
jgi:hypothetical protein